MCFIHVNAQLKVDAGSDVMVCSPNHSEDRTQLVGVASGGVEPYTYTWKGKLPIYYNEDSIKWIKASEFLNDTTISNPSFKSMDAPEDWVTFHLKVKDAAGNVGYDSVKVIAATIYSKLPYKPPVTIKRGDSIQFYGDIYFDDNAFLPMEYTFSPIEGLTDLHDVHGWAKPDTSTTYYLQVVNSAGCVAKMNYWRINVDTTTLSTNSLDSQSAKCYLSQGDLVIYRSQNQSVPYEVTISTSNGAVIYRGKYSERDLRLTSLGLKDNQLYIVSIDDGKGKQVFKVIGN